MFCLSGTWAGGDKPISLPVEFTVKVIMENMVILQELSGDATISNCTYLHYSVLEEIPTDGIERKVGKERPKVIYLFFLWKMPNHYYMKLDTDEIWICRLTKFIY